MTRFLRSGDEIDGFRVGEVVHTGGMAAIYAATGGDGSLPLVIKVPRLGPGEHVSSIISFEMEQQILSALKGPHVPRVVASGDVSECPYLVMERIDGPSLQQRAATLPLPAEEVARIGAAVAAALHDLHVQEVIHLDVKPSNVLFRPTGEAVLIDFGLARHAHFPDLVAEEVGGPSGTAEYVAPEQVLGIRHDPRSDTFALGALLYELCTGVLPFGSPTTRGGLRQRLHVEPPPPRSIVPAVPEWLQEVILRCLEGRSADRYPSAAQVALDLAHPEQIQVAERGRRTRPAGVGRRLSRWFRAAGYEPDPHNLPSVQLATAPIVLVSMHPAAGDDERSEALRHATALLVAGASTRLACLTVIPPVNELEAAAIDDTAIGQRLRYRLKLRNWAEPLRLPPARISYHVVESNDAAGVILDYARANRVDHIVLGAPPPRVSLAGMLGGVTDSMPALAAPEPLQIARLALSVASRVMTDAPCTVTVVRTARLR